MRIRCPSFLRHRYVSISRQYAPGSITGLARIPIRKGADKSAGRGGASRLAALLFGHKCPICSLVAPGQPGAGPRMNTPYFGRTTLELNLDVRAFPQMYGVDELDATRVGLHDQGARAHAIPKEANPFYQCTVGHPGRRKDDLLTAGQIG